MNLIRVSGLILLLCTIGAEARQLMTKKNPDCPEIGSFTYYRDDFNGKQYIMIVGCDGKTCLRPFTGPIESEGTVLPLPFDLPTNWTALVASSLAITTPGAMLPIYVRDANGADRHFRNPIDSAEEAYYRELYRTHEQPDQARISETPKLDPQTQAIWEQVKAEYPSVFGPSSSAPRDVSAGKKIFALYLERKHGPRPTAEQAIASSHEDLRVMGEIDVNLSNLTIRETPGSANGYALKLAPIAPEIASPITVSRADGTIVWSGGNVSDAVAIDLSGEPGGIYFVQGLGKGIVVNLVR